MNDQPEFVFDAPKHATKMNPEIKAQWVEALRSGEYLQGSSHLAREDRHGVVHHCCLGVLSELAVKAGVATKETGDPGDKHDGVITFIDAERKRGTALLTTGVVNWAGLDVISPIVATENGHWQHLTGLNDTRVPFTTIADLIEVSL